MRVVIVSSDLQKELAGRILKEYKPVQRQVEKLRERFNQRYTRHSRSLQDRRAKDKFTALKNAKDSLSAVRAAEEKSNMLLQKDLRAWNSSMLDKIEVGKAVFLGTHHLSDAKSPSRPAAAAGKGPPSIGATSASSITAATTAAKAEVPPRLKEFLSSALPSSLGSSVSDLHAAAATSIGNVPRGATQLTSEEALTALVSYFHSSNSAAHAV